MRHTKIPAIVKVMYGGEEDRYKHNCKEISKLRLISEGGKCYGKRVGVGCSCNFK